MSLLSVQVVCVPPLDTVGGPPAPEVGLPELDPEDLDPDPAADLAPDPVASSADAAGLALLLVLRGGRWGVEGIYD